VRGYVYLSILIVIFSTASLLIAVPSLDDFSLYNPLWNGLSTLRERYGFEYTTTSNIQSLPQNAIVFVFPSKPIDGGQAEALKGFLSNGGTVVLLDEYGYSNSFLHSIGSKANITSELLRDPLFKYKSSELPYAWVDLGGKTFKVCLNYASTLQPGESKVLGLSSYFSFLDEDLDGSHDYGEPSGRMCIASSYAFGRGLLIVFSDSSIFLNSMLNLGENSLLLEELCKNRKPYLLEDLLCFGAYTTLRESFISTLTTLYNLMFHSSISYPLMFLTALLVFSAVRRLYPRLEKRYIPLDFRSKLHSTLRLHPSWNRKVLEEILPEVFEGFEHSRED
jgi:hypothetical protein